MHIRFAMSAVAIAASTTLLLTGCVNNETPETPHASASQSADSGTNMIVDSAAAALLPADINSAQKLIIGIDATYPPNEFKNDAGEAIGWGVDLGDAMAARLGSSTEWKLSSFDNIIPSITGGTMDLGLSSFIDNVKREKQVDFVDYYKAGSLWAAPKGKSVDPNNACGLTVAVQATTFQDTDELPAKSAACVEAGKPEIKKLKFTGQDEVSQALSLGRADAMTAAGPAVGYAVAQSDGKLQVVGKAFNVAPYGIAVAKDSKGLDKAVQAAVQSMMDDGSYMKILEKWGVEDGAVPEADINAGSQG